MTADSLFTKAFCGDRIKNNATGEKCNLQKCMQDFSWKGRRKEFTWGISIDVGIILKGILNNQATRLYTDFKGSRIWFSLGFS
jgi:hypothetical protein